MFNSWRTRRQIVYGGITCAVILLFAFLLFHKTIFPPASCFDGRQDGNETGVDCGGSCALQCANEAIPIQVLWVRPLQVTQNVWSAVAYIENRNAIGVPNLSYTLTLLDENGQPILSKTDSTFIPPNVEMPLFIGGFEVGSQVPVTAELTNLVVGGWYKATVPAPTLTVQDVSVVNTDSTPAITASVANPSLNDLTDVPVTILVYDTSGNVIAASKTFIDSLPGQGSEQVFFTWPRPFSVTTVGVKDILPLADPFSQ